jgi:hypothetical protein
VQIKTSYNVSMLCYASIYINFFMVKKIFLFLLLLDFIK